MSHDDPVEIPVDGTLDLHTFHPQDVKDLVPHYLAVCREKGIYHVRIVHGKGTGTLRDSVHSLLKKNSLVKSYRLAGEDGGSWGATLVELRKSEE